MLSYFRLATATESSTYVARRWCSPSMAALMEVVDRYVDGSESVLEERKDAFQERVDDFTDRIDDLNERIASLKIQMTKRFTALEQTMQTLNQQSSALLGLVTGASGQ